MSWTEMLGGLWMVTSMAVVPARTNPLLELFITSDNRYYVKFKYRPCAGELPLAATRPGFHHTSTFVMAGGLSAMAPEDDTAMSLASAGCASCRTSSSPLAVCRYTAVTRPLALTVP